MSDRDRALLDGDEGPARSLAAELWHATHASEAASGGGAHAGRAASPAGETGRRAADDGLALGALQRLFAHLHEALFALLLDEKAPADPLSAEGVERCTARANALLWPSMEAATDAWLDTRGSGEGACEEKLARLGQTLRHDIKTPLQAASLNLELLAIESAERGLDAEAIGVVQQSLDQAIDMLREFDVPDG